METLVFLDTCSLLVASWDSPAMGRSVAFNMAKDRMFWGTVIPELISKGRVILTKRNYDELVKLSRVGSDPKRPLLGERCDYILKKIADLLASDHISVVGDANDPFADAILLSVALKFRTKKNLLFVTQDRDLASDLHALSLFRSVRPRKGTSLIVKRVNRDGGLSGWCFPATSEQAAHALDKSTVSMQASSTRVNTPRHAEPLRWWEA